MKSVNITAVVTVVVTVVVTAVVTVVVTVVNRGNENHSPSSLFKSEVVRVSSRDVASTFSLFSYPHNPHRQSAFDHVCDISSCYSHLVCSSNIVPMAYTHASP